MTDAADIVYARHGERILCGNGHDIGIFRVSVLANGTKSISPEMLTWTPIYRDVCLGRCTCGSPWIVAGFLRFLDGWRGYDPLKKAVIRTASAPGTEEPEAGY